MSKNYQKTVENLNWFLSNTEGERREEVVSELRASGVNIEGFISDIKGIVAAGGQPERLAQPAAQAGFSRLGRFAHSTRAEILKLVEELLAGDSLSESVLTTRESSDLGQLSDEQLQVLLNR